jgi:hypothetical protein
MRQFERGDFLQMIVQQPGVIEQRQQDQGLAPRQRTALARMIEDPASCGLAT